MKKRKKIVGKKPVKVTKKITKKARKVVKKKTREIKKITRVGSGIKNFDKYIEGGLPANSVNLVVGSSGSGKTIFAIQFLLEGVRRSEKVLYITFEEKKDEVYLNMKRFGWDLESLEKQSKFFFLEYTPEKVKSMLEEGGGSIESIVIKYKIKRIVIDSFTSFAMLFENELLRREASISLFSMLRNWGCTSFLTLEEEDVGERNAASSSVEFEADSIILLYFIREKRKRGRYIEILKMHGTKHSTEVHAFNIGKGGIVVSPKVYVGKIRE